jgi:thiol-disulfide isomerase/thioredoxin
MDSSSPTVRTNQPLQESLIRKAVAATGLVVLLAAPALLLVVLQRSGGSQTLRDGDPIPVEALGRADPGNELLAIIKGKPSAILFFSADCPHCQREIPIYNEAQKRFASQVEFVAIALSNRQKTEAFIQTNDVVSRVLVDENGVVGRIFGISELPALFLMNQDQKIEWVGVGEQPRTEVLRRMSRLAGNDLSTVTQGTGSIRK